MNETTNTPDTKVTNWRPKENDFFWHVSVGGIVILDTWREYDHYINFYKLGNCYHSEREAKENRYKWIDFYASEDVLEV